MLKQDQSGLAESRQNIMMTTEIAKSGHLGYFLQEEEKR